MFGSYFANRFVWRRIFSGQHVARLWDPQRVGNPVGAGANLMRFGRVANSQRRADRRAARRRKSQLLRDFPDIIGK
jgi:hypothetical protein